jgi:hypothetical protein
MFNVGRSMFDVPSSIANLLFPTLHQNTSIKTTIRSLGAILAMALLTSLSPAQADQLRCHAISDSDIVLQRGKLITI